MKRKQSVWPVGGGGGGGGGVFDPPPHYSQAALPPCSRNISVLSYFLSLCTLQDQFIFKGEIVTLNLSISLMMLTSFQKQDLPAVR